MYCIDCNYELLCLEAGRCPECGRTFDPDDETTYRHNPSKEEYPELVRVLEWVLLGSGSLPLLANAFGLLMLLVARASLGRWPDMRGSESPNTIPATQLLSELDGFLMIGLVFAPFAIFLLSVALCIESRTWRAVRFMLLAIGLWAAGIALAVWDPLFIWNWIFD